MFEELIQKLQEFDTVGVFSHIRPDGDCIGAQVAACRWLEKNGVNAIGFNDDDVPLNLQWLADFYPIQEPDEKSLNKCDAFLVLDGNSPKRFGSYSDYIQDYPKPSFMVDHHPDPHDGFDLSISVEEASSTCELIFHLFLQNDISQVDEKTAKALYTGILTDTGSLQYDSVTPEPMNISSELLRLGQFRTNEVAEKVFSPNSLNQLDLLSKAMIWIECFAEHQRPVM